MNTRDILITFDTTGSMYPCIGQVRKNVSKLVDRLFKDVSDIRIGILAHGDYCDERSSYVTKMLDFTTDVNKLVHFVNNVSATGGGDADECYELVLNQARSASWGAGNSKSVIMIGDANPHEPSYPMNTRKLDWRNEAKLLGEAGIKIYSVQALPSRHSARFYESIANVTGGFHLELDQFSNLYYLIMGVGLQQMGNDVLQNYENELITNGQYNRNIDSMFGKMLGRSTSRKFVATSTSLGAVDPGRFQVMDVDSDCAIKDFVEDNGITFKKGRGFYQFTKRTLIQDYKEVILMNKATGDLFNGDKAREIAGIPVGTSAEVSPEKLTDYIVFVQSTSVNRALKAGTKFLYEVTP
jgi:hypothetical protein